MADDLPQRELSGGDGVGGLVGDAAAVAAASSDGQREGNQVYDGVTVVNPLAGTTP